MTGDLKVVGEFDGLRVAPFVAFYLYRGVESAHITVTDLLGYTWTGLTAGVYNVMALYVSPDGKEHANFATVTVVDGSLAIATINFGTSILPEPVNLITLVEISVPFVLGLFLMWFTKN